MLFSNTIRLIKNFFIEAGQIVGIEDRKDFEETVINVVILLASYGLWTLAMNIYIGKFMRKFLIKDR